MHECVNEVERGHIMSMYDLFLSGGSAARAFVCTRWSPRRT
ncbi:hypothetical protein EGR_10970 [Echinococcus granulosus]|uniref:Uncharacterized protein n=1 Tax=Echinococcus granulosus TaxID=6210 RepID=W6UKZ7_ECHGR|nr:hypothetical protein EGR_10970 [Echinococcus granulosus]EUB54174.1 hypothetical protein EGR_10970 [Echinococcus granulosus]